MLFLTAEQLIDRLTKKIEKNPSSKLYLTRARHYFNIRKVAEAEQDLTQYLNLEPKDSKAYYHRASCRKELGNLQGALEDAELSMSLKANEDTAVLLGNIQLELGKLEEARTSFEKALKLNPLTIDAYEGFGNAFLAEGDIASAIEKYSEGIQTAPKRPHLYNARGWAKLELKDWKGAYNDFNTALKKYRFYPEAMAGLGEAYLGRGDTARAMEWVEKALKENPELGLAYCSKGKVFQSLGKHGEAYLAFNEAIENGFSVAYGYRGVSLVELGKPEAALQDFENVQVSSKTPKFLLARGLAKKDMGDFEGARADLAAYVEVEPDNVLARSSLAWLLAKAGNFEDALAHELMVELAEPTAISAYNLACFYAKTGDLEKVLEMLGRVKERDASLLANIQADSDFDSLRSDPKFSAFLAS